RYVVRIALTVIFVVWIRPKPCDMITVGDVTRYTLPSRGGSNNGRGRARSLSKRSKITGDQSRHKVCCLINLATTIASVRSGGNKRRVKGNGPVQSYPSS